MRKLLFQVAACSFLPAAPAQAGPAVVFEGARLIDGTGRPALEDSALLVESGRIAAVGAAGEISYPRGARVVDARGRVIMPGLIGAHSHLGLTADGQNRADAYTRENIRGQALQYERYGVTSVLSLGFNADLGYELRDEQELGRFPGAAIFTAGRGIAPKDASLLPVGPGQLYRPLTLEQARAAVRDMAARRADIVKFFVDDFYGRQRKMDSDMSGAVIEEAHRLGIKAAAHVFYLDDAKALASAGVDILAHGIRDQAVDDELIRAMKSGGIFYIPTLLNDESESAFPEEPSMLEDDFLVQAFAPEILRRLKERERGGRSKTDPAVAGIKAAFDMSSRNLKTLSDAGVRIAFGADSGARGIRPPGWSEHRELELMVRAGLSPMAAIVAATRESAALLGASDRGTLEAGKRADFLVLSADPLDDIRNTRRLVAVWRAGREVHPRAAAPADE